MRLNKIFMGALAILAIATPAIAQDRRAYRGNDQSYYDQRCDNRVAGRALTQCTREALATSDRDLNISYNRLLRDARNFDAQDRGRRLQGWYSQEIALRNAQRAWITMRDADCRFVTQPDLGRRRSQLTYTMCLVERTEDRTVQLEAMRNQMRPSR